ncbi:MAG: DUF4403 family protein [Chitinispirillia bacterium]|nr:DUF4403 family protein [Chitinispirillia bacterium]MCL2240897.1 DUF4403 family protein [Chitinispirillia bacterium]
MRITITFFIAIITCALAGCTNRPMTAPAGGGSAAETPPPAPLTPVPSVINIPAEIKMSYIENAVNKQLSGNIYRNNAYPVEGIGSAQITVKKDGRIKIRANRDMLTYKIPLKISLRFSFSILGHTEYQDVDAGIAIALRSKYTLKNNWQLATTTTVDGYEWTTAPTVKIRFITIPVKPIADFLVSKQAGIINDLGKMVDNAVLSEVNLKTMVAPLWQQFQIPTEIAIPDMTDRLWLRFDPSDIYMAGITGRGESVSAMMGIRAVTEAVIGDKPNAPAPKPLPNFKTSDKQDSSFTINLYAEIPFTKATGICRELFVGQTLKSGRQKVLVHDIDISGGNDGLAHVKMDLSGSLKGTVRVTGRAVYNESAQTLSIDNFNFDVETQSQFERTKNWLLKGIIMSKMRPLMKFPLDKQLDGTKKLLQEMLSERELYKGVVFNGRVDTLSVRGIEVTGNAFRAVVLAKGTAGVKIKD